MTGRTRHQCAAKVGLVVASAAVFVGTGLLWLIGGAG